MTNPEQTQPDSEETEEASSPSEQASEQEPVAESPEVFITPPGEIWTANGSGNWQ